MNDKPSSGRNPVVLAMSAAFAIALSGLAEEAAASTISASGSGYSSYVSSSTSGLFNISGALAGNTAVSGLVTAYFTDDGDAYQYNGGSATGYSYTGSNQSWGYSYSYCCGLSTCYADHYYTNNYYAQNSTAYYLNPGESALLSIGTSASSAASGYYYGGTNYNGYGQYSNWNGDGYNYYTTYYYDYFGGYTGSFSVSMYLDAAALADLNGDGILGFGIGSNYGDFLVTGVSGTFELVENVPEPGSLALLGLALGGLGFSRRARKQKLAPA